MVGNTGPNRASALEVVVVVHKTRKSHHNCSRPISHPSTIEEACRLVEAGFEYVCDVSEAKIFRKRKEPLKNLLQCSERVELRKVGRERFELSTFRLSAERSNHAELPALTKSRIIMHLLRVFRRSVTLCYLSETPYESYSISCWSRTPL